MNPAELAGTILEENRKLLRNVSREAVERFVRGLDRAERIFCTAQGRSGYILRCFCMRLMHLGYQAFFVGETITPSIGEGDILFVLSGSGQTSLTHELVKLAREQQATTYGVIGANDSPVGRELDDRICLSGGAEEDRSGGLASIQPLGSLFEQAAFVLLESLVLGLYQMKGSDSQAVLERHSNLQ